MWFYSFISLISQHPPPKKRLVTQDLDRALSPSINNSRTRNSLWVLTMNTRSLVSRSGRTDGQPRAQPATLSKSVQLSSELAEQPRCSQPQTLRPPLSAAPATPHVASGVHHSLGSTSCPVQIASVGLMHTRYLPVWSYVILTTIM